MNSSIIDASAALALILDEPGADKVHRALLDDGIISAVNLSEVVTKLIERDVPQSSISDILRPFRGRVVPFTEAHALVAGQLRFQTRPLGLSLGDRACLGVAQILGRRAVTADRIWLTIHLGIEVVVIR